MPISQDGPSLIRTSWCSCRCDLWLCRFGSWPNWLNRSEEAELSSDEGPILRSFCLNLFNWASG